VSRWYAMLGQGGTAALRRKPHTGRPPRLSAKQWTLLARILESGATRSGFDTERWTLRRIAVVIRREFGIEYNHRSLGRVLHAHGWTPQKPVIQARERDDQLVEAWLKRDWPRIKRGLAAQDVPLPSWTRRVTRFGPTSAPPGHPGATRPC